MKRDDNRIPHLIFGFPVAEENSEDASHKNSQRGIALMVAVMIISVMMMFVADLIVSSTVNLTKASAQRDNVRAEYVAKSGANWAIWLNLFDYGLQLQLGSNPATKTLKDGIGDIWDKLGEIFPYDSGLDLSQAGKFAEALGLSGLMDRNLIDMMSSLGGELGVKVEDESGKININVCYQSQAECSITMLQLEALMSCTAIEQDYNKQHNIKTAEIVRRIKDYVDKNNVAESGSGYSDENDPYGKRKPPQKVKNSPLDSLEELLTVDGWTRDLHAYYSSYMTVWPYPDTTIKNGFKININTMPQEALRCMFGRELGTPDAMEKFVKRYRELIEKNGRIAASDAELQSVLSEVIGYRNESTEKGGSGDKATWLTTESKAFKIKAKGIVGEQTRILEYVIQRSSQQQMAAASPAPPWTLAFFKMY